MPIGDVVAPLDDGDDGLEEGVWPPGEAVPGGEGIGPPERVPAAAGEVADPLEEDETLVELLGVLLAGVVGPAAGGGGGVAALAVDAAEPAGDMAEPPGARVVPGEGLVVPGGDVLRLLGEVMRPVGDVDELLGEVVGPLGEVVMPLKEVVMPPEKVAAPVRDVFVPLGVVVVPLGEVVLPIGEGAVLAGRVLVPLGEVVVPAGEGGEPAGGLAVPTVGGGRLAEGVFEPLGEMAGGLEEGVPLGDMTMPPGGTPLENWKGDEEGGEGERKSEEDLGAIEEPPGNLENPLLDQLVMPVLACGTEVTAWVDWGVARRNGKGPRTI